MPSVSDEFADFVRTRLEPLTRETVAYLKDLLANDFPSEFRVLHFEVFTSGFTDHFPVHAFFYDEHFCEHFEFVEGEALYPCRVDPEILHIDHVYESDAEDRFQARDEDADLWQVAGESLIDWFSDCWVAAGGTSFDRDSRIAIHDADRAFDLRAQEWRTFA
jgi:hypothetical protein